MARPPRIRLRGATTGQWSTTYAAYTPRPNELCFDITTGKYRVGDGETLYAELAALSPSAAELATLNAEVGAHETRLDLIEGAQPPPPDPETAVLRYACVSYIYPGSSGAAEWAILADNSAAGKLAYVIANPDSGPGYEAKHEPGGSTHTHWTNRLSALTGDTKKLFYISTNYGDTASASGSHAGAGTVGANYRFTANVDDTIQFWEKGTTSSLGGALGSARSMTFPAGFGPVAVKSWYSGTAAGTTLPGGLALSTSYYLRPVGSTPTQTYTLHTSSAGAIANTGKVNITSTGGGSGLGPFFMGLRRNLANVANVCAEMTRCVTLHPTLCGGWFFDEARVSQEAHDAWWDAIVAYRDANHPGLQLVVNGTPHNATRANLYDVFVMENNWSAFEGATEVPPSYLTDLTVAKEKAWAIIHDDVTAGDLADAVTFCVANNIGLVYLNGPSAFGDLPTDGVDGFDQADVIAAIDVANA